MEDHNLYPLAASISSTDMRRCCPLSRTLPSSTERTDRSRAISLMLSVEFLNAKDEVRAATRNWDMPERSSSSSSAMPSEKYSFFGSPLILAKGRTAMEFFGGAGFAGKPCACTAGEARESSNERSTATATSTTVHVAKSA